MNTDIKTIEDLETFVNDHLKYCFEVFMGRQKDDNGSIILHDDYWKGVNSAYVNIHNAINKLKCVSYEEDLKSFKTRHKLCESYPYCQDDGCVKCAGVATKEYVDLVVEATRTDY